MALGIAATVTVEAFPTAEPEDEEAALSPPGRSKPATWAFLFLLEEDVFWALLEGSAATVTAVAGDPFWPAANALANAASVCCCC